MAKMLEKYPRSHTAEDYSYVVSWSEEDNAFVARVTEFPSMAAHGSSHEEALREARRVVTFVLDDLAEADNIIDAAEPRG